MFHSLYVAVSLGFLSYLSSSMGKHIKVCPLRKVRTEKKVPGTLCLLSLSPSSRNTLHTDQGAFASPFKNSLNNVPCTGFTQFKSTEIKTQKLLGDYSSQNSECNRRELRTLEIYFLESV